MPDTYYARIELFLSIVSDPGISMAITFLVMSQMFYKLDAQQCIIRGEYSIRGMMLKGHTFMEEKTGIWFNCLDKCDDDVRCQSFNFIISQGICELNNRTKEDRPEDFVPDSDRFYMKRFKERGIVLLWTFIYIDSLYLYKLNVPRTSLHWSRKLCLCLCFLLLIPLGSVPELPADSFAETWASEGEDAVSGNYWFDSLD